MDFSNQEQLKKKKKKINHWMIIQISFFVFVVFICLFLYCFVLYHLMCVVFWNVAMRTCVCILRTDFSWMCDFSLNLYPSLRPWLWNLKFIICFLMINGCHKLLMSCLSLLTEYGGRFLQSLFGFFFLASRVSTMVKKQNLPSASYFIKYIT